MTAGAPVLEVKGLEAAYGRARVLFGVDVTVPAGGLLCVMGRNGVGKTTLLNAVTGVLPPTAGTVAFGGEDVTRTPTHQRVRRGMGYVPQGHETFPQLTVAENLQVTLEATAHRDKGAIEEALEVFPRLREFLGRRAGFLSGGQQQQLAIARALVMRPKLLVLDEPTEGIQPSIIKDIGRVIALLRSQGEMAILLVEQYYDFAQELAQTIAVMDRGDIVLYGPRDALDEADVRRRLSV